MSANPGKFKGGITMKLVPLGDKIVLKQLEAEETTKSGIVLPGTGKKKNRQEAEVIADRTGRKYRWKRSSNAGKRGR